jgi:glycosyltransferase involved in cell wall biosynthesis
MGDVAELAGALRRLQDDALRSRLGSAAALAAGAYRAERIAGEAGDFYRLVLGRRRAPAGQ